VELAHLTRPVARCRRDPAPLCPAPRLQRLSLLVAALIALPLGVLIGHTGRGGFLIVNLANAWRAIPTLGLLILMVVLLGFSVLAWLIRRGPGHSAHPGQRLRGVAGVDRDLTDAARGMGMTESQVLRKVEIPVALPLIMLGLRTGAISCGHRHHRRRDRRRRPGPLHHRRAGDQQLRRGVGRRRAGVILALLVQIVFTGLRRLVVPAPLPGAGAGDS